MMKLLYTILIVLNVVQVVEAYCHLCNLLKARKTICWKPLSSSVIVFSSSCTEDLVRERFRTTMMNNSTRTFSSWSDYEKFLPRRKYTDANCLSTNRSLYTLINYYTRNDDLERFADEISKPLQQMSRQIRTSVKYITAPTNNGKTSCVLPAFLKTNLTHYSFIAFSNNANSNYKLRSTFNFSDDADKAHQ
jgi:hypothetical protein